MAQPTIVRTHAFSASQIFMLIACGLFVLAALSAGLSWSINPWCFGWGGFASVALAWAI